MNKIFYYSIGIFHALLIVFFATSFIFLPFAGVVLWIALFWIQILIFKGCLLSKAQFGDIHTNFWDHYLKKIIPGISTKQVNNFTDVWGPLLIILVGYVWQHLFKIRPVWG